MFNHFAFVWYLVEMTLICELTIIVYLRKQIFMYIYCTVHLDDPNFSRWLLLQNVGSCENYNQIIFIECNRIMFYAQ